MTACVGTSEQVQALATACRRSGQYYIKSDPETVRISNLDGTVVYAALLKSPGVWIVRYSPDHFAID